MSASTSSGTPGRSGGLAVVTMVRGDALFLDIWARYWRRFVPAASMVVVLDGPQDALPKACDGCQILTLPPVAAFDGFDRARWNFLSHLASALSARFEAVLLTDVDEIVVLDPGAGDDPAAYILGRAEEVINPFAMEIVHRIDLEPAFDPARPVLAQRRYGRINASYCKPCITRGPIRWSMGGHQSDHGALHLSPDLYLLHLRYLDLGILRARQALRRGRIAEGSGDVAGHGWSKSADAMEGFLQSFVDKGAPEENGLDFGWQRGRIARSFHYDAAQAMWRRGTLTNRRTYTLPERFAGLF